MPFAQINGKNIFYSWKPASRAGLTLYFIHGLGGSHSFWEPCIPGLVEAGFSCLAFDVPGMLTISWIPSQGDSRQLLFLTCGILGFGQSPYNGKPHDLHDIAEDCVALLEKFGKPLSRTIIVGASMAGIICYEIAVKHQVAGIVSVGPICPGPETQEAFKQRVEVVKNGRL